MPTQKYDPDKDDPVARALSGAKAYLAGLDVRGATPRDLPRRPKPSPPPAYTQNPTTESAFAQAEHFGKRNAHIARKTRLLRD